MSTVRDFIKTRDIPKDVKQTALAEYDAIGLTGSIPLDETATSLGAAFTWKDAPSGYKFWRRIANAEPMPPLNFTIAHHYTGKDCCGILYWSNDGRILCNECGAEFELKEKGGE